MVMQKIYTFKIILSVALSFSVEFANAQTAILLAPGNAPVASSVLSEYSGNFGIGVAMPTVKLDVSAAGKFQMRLKLKSLNLLMGKLMVQGLCIYHQQVVEVLR